MPNCQKFMKKKILVVGLGYVGINIFYNFLKKNLNVYGYDTSNKKIENIKRGFDDTLQYKKIKFIKKSKLFTKIPKKLVFDYIILCLPTPLKNNNPDLSYLIKAFKKIRFHLNDKAIIINESTVYPGVTRKLALDFISSNKNILNLNYFISYSPERISPGDGIKFSNIRKIISVSDNKVYSRVYKLYKNIIDKKITKASNLETAEAVKILENSQRDLNIALVNQYNYLFKKLELNTTEIINLASSKWNFYKVFPGLVGGQCIPIDPYYALKIAKQKKIDLSLIKESRIINENLKKNLLKVIFEEIAKRKNKIKILQVGITYKLNTSDYKYAKEFELFKSISKKIKINYYDENVKKISSLKISKKSINILQLKDYNFFIVTNSVSKKILNRLDSYFKKNTNNYVFNLTRYTFDEISQGHNKIVEPLK